MAAEWTAFKLSPTKAELHFQLEQVLEEQRYAQDLNGIKTPVRFLFIFGGDIFVRCSIHQLVFVFLVLPWQLIPLSLGFTISRVQDNFQRLSLLLYVVLYLFTFFHGLIPVTSSQSL